MKFRPREPEPENIVFFDSECPLCRKAVKHILEIDVHRRFAFAPLNGETAGDVLTGPQEALTRANSLILVENYRSTDRKFWIKSRAVFRIYWLAGNGWGLIGILSFLPGWAGDFFYDWTAAHRHQFKLLVSEPLGPNERFLP